MQEIEPSAGMIEYEDTGSSGPIVVLLHGLLMDGSLWRHVLRELCTDYRCIVPTLPLGGHRQPIRADADLSPRGIGQLEAEFLERLDLHNITLVGNDSGLFQIAAEEGSGTNQQDMVDCEGQSVLKKEEPSWSPSPFTAR